MSFVLTVSAFAGFDSLATTLFIVLFLLYMKPARAEAWLVALSVMSGACWHVSRLFYKGSVFFVFIGCFKHKCCNLSTILVQINITTYWVLLCMGRVLPHGMESG